jgi:multidrug resistance efflux pump
MIRRFGRPGLIGTMARTAVIAGTATAVVGGVSRHQQQSAQANAALQQQQADEAAAAAQQQYAPPPPAAAPAEDRVTAQLEQLAQLHSQGILSDEEFSAAKAKALGI